MDSRASLPTTAFEKSLRSFQTGGLTYGDFLDDLRRLLAAGAPVGELQEILGRRQAIEPMSDSTHHEVARVLDAAAAAATAEPAAEPPAVDTQNLSAAGTVAANEAAAGAARVAGITAARTALEAAQNKTREITELARARISEAAQDNERLRNEAERVRNDAAQLRQSLAERDLTISGERAATRRGLEEQKGKIAETSAQFAEKLAAVEADRAAERVMHAAALASLTSEHEQAAQKAKASAAAELATARRALDEQRSKVTEGSAELTKKLAAIEAERAAERVTYAAALASLASEHEQAVQKAKALAAAELATARRALDEQRSKVTDGSAELTKKLAAVEAERATQAAVLVALQDEHAQARRSQDALSSSRDHLEADLQATQRRSSSLTTELANARRALEDNKSLLSSIETAKAASDSALRAAEQQLRTADQQLRAAEHQQTDVRQLRESLAGRDAELIALRQEHSKTVQLAAARGAHVTQLQADLAAARARADTIEAQLKTSQEAAARVAASLSRRETELGTTVVELSAAKTQSVAYLESLQNREWRQGYEHSLDTAAVAPVPTAPTKPAAMRRTALLALTVLALVVVGWLIARHQPRATVAVSQAAPPLTIGSVLQDCATCPTLTVLPAGRFKQGSAPTDANYSAFEGPQHWVMLERPLALSTNPVTVDQFAPFVAATGRDMQGCDTYDGAWKTRPDGSWKDPGFAQTGTHPVTCVSFDDATAYAQWLTAQTGHTYRLPSASEWEYAARAGGTAAQPWQSASDACKSANVADASAARRYPGWRVFACDDGFVNTAPVGSFHANAFGLNDMLGNVFQWTQDCWNGNYANAPIDGSARSSGDCRLRELRGGSWFSAPKFVRATYRNQFPADYRASSVGIRVVREL